MGIVSIIICTLNRPEHLLQCARSIIASDYRELQLVVVDQSANDETAIALNALGDDRITYLPMSIRGKSRGLNYAIPHAKGDPIVFTDDDCVVEPDWLSAIVREFENDPDLQVVYGRVKAMMWRPNDSRQPSWIFTNWGVLDHPNPETYNHRTNVYRIGGIGMGSNMAYRRDAIARIGPFDENLGGGSPLGGGEDFDFIYRALRAGLKASYVPTAVLHHKQWKDAAVLVETLDVYIRSDAAIMVKHVKKGDWHPLHYYLSARIFQQFLIAGLLHHDRGRVREGLFRLVRLIRNLWFCWNWYRKASRVSPVPSNPGLPVNHV